MNAPAFVTLFPWTAAALLGVLYLSRNRSFAAKHGRVAVREFLERQGLTLIGLHGRPYVRGEVEAGLGGSSMLFEARTRTAAGEPRTYRLAFDPTGARGHKPGLKLFDDGAWRDASLV